jgi:hypothetical protein
MKSKPLRKEKERLDKAIAKLELARYVLNRREVNCALVAKLCHEVVVTLLASCVWFVR